MSRQNMIKGTAAKTGESAAVSRWANRLDPFCRPAMHCRSNLGGICADAFKPPSGIGNRYKQGNAIKIARYLSKAIWRILKAKVLFRGVDYTDCIISDSNPSHSTSRPQSHEKSMSPRHSTASYGPGIYPQPCGRS